MAMTREGYVTAYTAKTSEKVNLNEDGNIAQEQDVVAGSKRITMNGLNTANTLTTNHNVMALFYGIVGGYTDKLSNKFTITLDAIGG